LGTVIYATASLLYGWTPSILLLLCLRGYHGIGLGVYHTASSVYVTDITPAARRGQAIGVYGMMQTAAQAGAPATGVWVADAFGYDALWYLSSLLAVVAFAVTTRLTEA